METKQISVSSKLAREFYPVAPSEWKQILEASFGKEFFSLNPTDRIKTVEDACQVLSIDSGTVWHNLDQPDEVAFKKLKVIARALNFLANGNKIWIPDFNNSREPKHYPWFWMNEPGFRLDAVGYDASISCLGSRLVFKTEALARYAANQFSGLYSDLFEMQPEAATEQHTAAPKAITNFREIKTFEDACRVKGYDSAKVLPDVSVFPEPHRAALTGISKLFIINEAINQADNDNKPWAPDWNDGYEEKHYPWADMEVDGNNPSGFRLGDVNCDDSMTDLGSRLVYKSEDGARHAFAQFEGIYKDVMVLK